MNWFDVAEHAINIGIAWTATGLAVILGMLYAEVCR